MEGVSDSLLLSRRQGPGVCSEACRLSRELSPSRCASIGVVLSTSRALTCLAAEKPRPLLVICRSRGRAEQVSRLLTERLHEGIPFYHHGLDGSERAGLRTEYLCRDDAALVATPAGGGELVRSDLRTLVHARPPSAASRYLMEACWAGRDSRAAERILLLPPPGPFAGGKAGGSVPGCPWARPECRAGACACEFGAACRRALEAVPPGWRGIVAAVAANNRSLSLRELCLLLGGKKGFASAGKKLYKYTGFGYLCSWQSEDISEAVSSLISAGVLRVPGRGAWRRCVALDYREVWWKIHFRNCCERKATARAV